MSSKLRQKPHLNEIFTAFSGIGHAAMGVKNRHVLDSLEQASSFLRYELRQVVLEQRESVSQAEYQDMAAGKALRFLKSWLPMLKDHQDTKLVNAQMKATGGTLADVILHIESLLEREASGKKREVLKCSFAGDLTPKFTAAYISTNKGFKKPSYEQDMDEFLAEDSPESKKPVKKPKAEKLEIISPVLVAKDRDDEDSIAIPSFLPVREPAIHA